MANITQKSKDPTEVALSAIQDALKVGSGETSAAAPEPAAGHADAAGPDLFQADQREGLRQPANDDREQVGEILQTLRSRPTRTPYLIAGAAGIAWAVIGLVLTWAFSADIAALFVTPRFGYAAVAGIAAAIILPMVGFYAIAHLLSRALRSRKPQRATRSSAWARRSAEK
jgi:hypothetical protein